jgi:trk system potassium uptake protein TrkA
MAAKQVLVVGLGQFGLSLVRSMAAAGVEVIAVDSVPEKVRMVADVAASVSCIDATDEIELAALAPERRDACICAIGDESRESSIICTALLRQMGAPRIVARATDPVHERILSLIGAHEVINPESVVGHRVATRMAYEGILDELSLGENLVVTEVVAPFAIVGHSLADLELPQRYEVTVAAVRRGGEIVMPRGDISVQQDDRLILVSRPARVAAMLESLR